MTDEITTRMLLEHMQAMKSDLLQRIGGLDGKVDGLGQRLSSLEIKVTTLEDTTKEGFKNASLHRQTLQEDLEATILMVGKHDTKLAHL